MLHHTTYYPFMLPSVRVVSWRIKKVSESVLSTRGEGKVGGVGGVRWERALGETANDKGF